MADAARRRAAQSRQRKYYLSAAATHADVTHDGVVADDSRFSPSSKFSAGPRFPSVTVAEV